MADLNGALRKLSVGDGLTDQELVDTLELFERLERDLGTLTRHFNPSYGLAHGAVMREMQALESFKHARERARGPNQKLPWSIDFFEEDKGRK